ncbi:MAG: VanZ family protein [Enterobacterales bacterium]|jgi:VanZ family protein
MFELINKKTYRLLFIIAIVLTLVSTLSVVSKSVAVHLINDKLGHALMFFFLAFLCSHALGKRFDYKAIFLLAIFGLVIEVIQYFLSWRSFSLLDWVADIVGIIAYDVIHRLKRTYYLRKGSLRKSNLEEKSNV